MFSSRIKSCLKSFLKYVSSSSTQLLVNSKQKKLSHLLVSHKDKCVYSKVYIVIYLLLSVISVSNCAANALVDSSSLTTDGYNLEELEAVFIKVAHHASTTTTKRSIIDNVYVPSITTVPTPSLTTFRYVVLLYVLSLFHVYAAFAIRCLVRGDKNITKRWKLYIHFLYFTWMDYVRLLSEKKLKKNEEKRKNELLLMVQHFSECFLFSHEKKRPWKENCKVIYKRHLLRDFKRLTVIIIKFLCGTLTIQSVRIDISGDVTLAILLDCRVP